MELEKRFLPIEELEIRTEDEGGLKISGYAALYNRKSDNLGGFVEILRPGAFRKALESEPDVKALFNHDPSSIFARTKNGSLALTENQTGLKFEAMIGADDEDGKRIYNKVKNGLIDQCSFAFACGEDGQKWTESKDGPMLREIFEVDLLADVSVVTNPAYPQTTVQARSILQEAGFDFDNIASLITRAKRGLPLTDSDRDLINASIMVLQSYIPEERVDLGEQDTRKDGDADLLDLMLRELELVEVEHKLVKERK